MGTLSNNSKVGDKRKDLILQTSSRLYVQVNDRFYEINFRGDDKKEEEEKEETPRVLFASDKYELDTTFEYPGDDYLIITDDGKFFKTSNNDYIQIEPSASNSNTFYSPISVATQESPFVISSTKLVRNLNAEYLNGYSSSDYLRKDQEITVNRGTINNITSNIVASSDLLTVLDLAQSKLTVDTINVNNLTVNSDNSWNTSDSSSINIISDPTYFGGNIKISNVTKIDKMSYYFSDEGGNLYCGNDNAIVGGYSIADLIFESYINDMIGSPLSTRTISYYANLLTNIEEWSSGAWVPYAITDDDFLEVDLYNQRRYTQLRFTPRGREVFEGVLYGGDSNCAIKIYDRWYNIRDYIGDISDKYAGITFECAVNNNNLKAGDILTGIGSDGILDALVVGCTDNKVRLILSGVDCAFSNMVTLSQAERWTTAPPDIEDDPDLYAIYESVMACINAHKSEIGVSVSAELKDGDILISNNVVNIIGNINNINNSVFGQLTGYGISSEGGCYFVNPGIALVNENKNNYLKISNKETSFIGVDSSGNNFITLGTSGNCGIYRENMCDINNHKGYCSLGPIIVLEDGSAIIGTGDTRITISADGVVSIPSKAIK